MKNQKGSMLLEVLLSILIFSFGILGMVGLQVIATHNSVDAENRATASIIANEIVSQMYLLKTVNLDSGTKATWQSRLSATKLPNVTGTIVLNAAANTATVTITWKAPYADAAAPANQYVTSVAI